MPSEDGEAVLVAYSLDGAKADELLADDEGVTDSFVLALRESLESELGATATSAGELGLQAWVTGPAGFVADLVTAFGGIDGVLLLVALGAVLLILVLVYRSPFLPFVVIFTAVFALCLAGLVVYNLAANGTLVLNGQSQGILSILVVGASVDYALLLVARYREELAPRRAPGRRDEARAAGLRRADRGQRRHRHRRRAVPPAVRPRLQPQPRSGRGDRHRVGAARRAHAAAGAPARLRQALARPVLAARAAAHAGRRHDRRARARRHDRRARPRRRSRGSGRDWRGSSAAQARPVWIVTALALCRRCGVPAHPQRVRDQPGRHLPHRRRRGRRRGGARRALPRRRRAARDRHRRRGRRRRGDHRRRGGRRRGVRDALHGSARGRARRRTPRRSWSTDACGSTSRRRRRPTPRPPSPPSRTCARPSTR